MGNIRRILASTQYSYVIINTSVSLIAFGRNVLFMKTLDLAEVGQIAMMQTIVLLVGFLQIGTINGAYILFAEQKPEQTQRIVNLLTAGLAGLVALAALAAVLGAGTMFAPLIARETLIVGIFAGLAMLASTWMNNLLIAKGELGKSNVINVVAVTASLILAVLSSSYGLVAALGSILLQPLGVALGALLVERRVRPSIELPNLETLRQLLRLGLMPYLGALFTLLTYQTERWTIAFVLGQEAIGQFYLVMMYMSFFTLIPAALLNVHFPRAIRALQNGELQEFGRIRRRHIIEILIYTAMALVVTISLLPRVVEAVLPQYQSSISLTFLVFPSLVLFVLRDSAALVLYSVKKTRPILVSGVILWTSYTALLGGAIMLGLFSLPIVVILRGVAILISNIYLIKARQKALRGLT